MPGIYLTHPEVVVDPAVAVPDWQLAPQGKARLERLSSAAWLASVTRIFVSPERKARETAAILAAAVGLVPRTHAEMGENDRSSTGYLPGPAFEAAADAFFARPDMSYLGWETAQAAQTRIVAAVWDALRGASEQDWVLFVGHGAVGTLLRQSMRGEPISRRGDQAAGGGCLFTFALPSGPAFSAWHRMEQCIKALPGLAPGSGNHESGAKERI